MIIRALFYCTTCGALFIDPPAPADVRRLNNKLDDAVLVEMPEVFITATTPLRPAVCGAHRTAP